MKKFKLTLFRNKIDDPYFLLTYKLVYIFKNVNPKF